MSKENEKVVAITTVDNPFNPIDEFDKWLQYDMVNGYNTSGLLARFAHTSDAFTDKENEEEIERAIDDIIAQDPRNIYIKVKS